MTRRILIVCLGNICRSPTAEAVLRAKAGAAGRDIEVDSAGTGAWHLGDPPHPPMVRAARGAGYDMSAIRARRLAREDFDRFDLILAADEENLAEIEARRPAGNATPARLFDPGGGIPDPYYTGDFAGALARIERAAEALLAQPQ